MKKNKKKRGLALALIIALLFSILPQGMSKNVKAEEPTKVTVENLGKKGTISIGDKTKTGNWYRMSLPEEKDLFCMSLGKTCHTDDRYSLSSTATYVSTSSDIRHQRIAYIGYWLSVVKQYSKPSFVFCQALLWSVEEGDTSESKLKSVITTMKKNTGYFSSKSTNELYEEIFEREGTIKSTAKWYSFTQSSRQKLMSITSESKPVTPTSVHYKGEYRQYVGIEKKKEDRTPMKGATFTIQPVNIDEVEGYKVNPTGTEALNQKFDDYTVTVGTDASGKAIVGFSYELQTEDYYYFSDEKLASLTESQKNEWIDKFIADDMKYAPDLKESTARAMMEREFVNHLDAISNSYIIKEISSGDPNILINPTYAAGKKVTLNKNYSSWIYQSPGVVSDNPPQWTVPLYNLEIIDNFKKGSVNFIKKDSYATDGKQHGDAVIDGAVYGLYNDAACTQAAEVYNTQGDLFPASKYVVKNGGFTTNYLQSGKTYYAKEIKAPEGYLLNSQVIPITVDGSKIGNVEYTPSAETVEQKETPILGQVAIKKYLSNNETVPGPLQYEEGAVFKVYLKSKGSFEACDDYERDVITTDANGYAVTKKLYYGTYKVEQVSAGNHDTMMCENIEDVVIDRDGKVYTYNLLNPYFKAYLRVVKKDKNTKRTLLIPGTTYEIKKVNEDTGEETLVKQSYSDGKGMHTVTQYVADASGAIMTVKPLTSGKYRIYETDCVKGYHISQKYVEVDINSHSDLCKYEVAEDGTTYITIEKEYVNEETYGRLKLYKTGELLASFNDGNFQYKKGTLKGTEFDVIAKEDIQAADGQGNWYQKGDSVCTIRTGEGAAFTKECEGITKFSVDPNGTVTVDLPLGKYTVKEKKTLYGYLLPTEDFDLEFAWNNKTEEYVFNSTSATDSNGVLSVDNKRAKADIHLLKIDEISLKGIEGVKFGLYTKDDIYNAEGQKIVNAGQLLNTFQTNCKGIIDIHMDLPLMSESYGKEGSESKNSGNYFVKELDTPQGYYLDGKEYPVHFEYANDSTSILLKDIRVMNLPTSVEISKVAATNSKEIDGCQLEVTDANGKNIVSWTSGDDKSIKINHDLPGEYQNVNGTINDKGNLILTGLLQNKDYILKEKRPADGYVTAESITFQVGFGEKGSVVSIKQEDGTYLTLADSLCKMVDEETKIHITKIASDTKKKLAGATFDVFDSKGNKVLTFTSKEEGNDITGKLAVGETYIFREIESPKGYTLADDVMYQVKDTKEVQSITITDEKQNVPHIPQTGNNTYLFLSLILFIIVCGGAGFVFRKRKAENKTLPKDEKQQPK